MIRSSSYCLAAAALLYLLLAPAWVAAESPGVLWETTSQPVMKGMPMPMPAQKSTVCAARTWTQPPPGGDKSCTSSNFQMADSKATWTVQCTGEMPMTGAGAITFQGADSYSGEIELKSAAMSMTVKLTGKKLGDCDNPQ
jgi:hypothetical protein